MRPDTTTRYAAHKVAIEAGFLTIDEVRAIEGLNPLTETQKDEDKEEGDANGENRAPGSDPEPDPEA